MSSDTIEQLICECKPCRHCAGEGEFNHNVPTYYSAGGLLRTIAVTQPCRSCHGTGQDHDDCTIHCEQPAENPGGAFDARYGITAAQLGIEVCGDCNEGIHELPGAKKCACACHGQERRAA